LEFPASPSEPAVINLKHTLYFRGNIMLTLEDLRSGQRPQVSEREFAKLRNCSVATLQKDRVRGSGIPFLKNPRTGRISYEAEAVLDYFENLQRCNSTSEYDTSAWHERLTKARKFVNERAE
jgi:hypothetical protein